MWKNMLDLDNIWKIKWHIMHLIVGMLRLKQELDGFNVLDVLIDLPMIYNIILLVLGKNWWQLENSNKLSLLKLLLSMLKNKL